MVQSILSYGILVWGGTSVGSAMFNKLCRLQNKIIINLFGESEDNILNVNLVYKRQNLLNLNDLYKLRVCMIMYKIINEEYAPFLYDQLIPLLNHNPYNTRQNDIFVRPFPRVKAVKINFLSNAVTVWNNVENRIRNESTVARVKKYLTCNLIEQY